jgi:O-antigen/teichoic acid export membrane protein
MDNSIYKKFAKDIGISASADVVLKLKGLIIIPILTKAFGAVNYGIWAQVAVITGLLGAVVIMGLDGAMMRFLPGKSKEEIREGFYSSLLWMLVIAAFLCLVLVFSSKLLAESFFGGVENSRFVILAGIVLISSPLANNFTRYFRTFTQIKTYNAIIVYVSLANAAAGAAVALLGYTVFELVIISILIDLTVVLISLPLIIRQIGIALPRFTLLKSYLTFGTPLIPASLSNWAINWCDRLFISYFVGISALGIYSVVYDLSYMFVAFSFGAILLVLTPVVSKLWNEDKRDDVKRVFKYSIKYALMFAIPVVFGFSILGKLFLTKFTTAEFATGYYLIPLVASGYIFFLVAGMAELVFWLMQKTKFVGIILTSVCVENIILNLLLIPRLGLAGAAIATAITFLTQMITSILISSKYFPIDYSVKFILKSLVASSIMTLAVWWFSPVSIIDIILAVFLGAVTYFVVLLALRGFDWREVEFFADFLPETKMKGWLLSVAKRRAKP